MMKGYLNFLGTGGSVGVPVIGCQCEVCTSTLEMNKRLRPSVWIREGGRQFVIDIGPDFRQQALRCGISRLDGVLLTHSHQDHMAGIDDLRPIYYRRNHSPLPVLLSRETAVDLQIRYSYIFDSEGKENFVKRLNLQLLPNQMSGEVIFQGTPIRYITYAQGSMPVNGFCFGQLAYLPDIRHFSPSIFEELKGIRYLIIGALRYTPSPMHFSIDEAIDFADTLKVERAWLTHLSHELDYHQVNAYLPPHIRLAYDGLEIEFE